MAELTEAGAVIPAAVQLKLVKYWGKKDYDVWSKGQESSQRSRSQLLKTFQRYRTWSNAGAGAVPRVFMFRDPCLAEARLPSSTKAAVFVEE
eukprot:3846356-Pyramimonas_sp.AAC.1